jgi:hypothetical protein
MTSLSPSATTVCVTNEVYDIMNVQIEDSNFCDTTFEYYICNASQKIIRKGYFKGLQVQLRLSFFEEGMYLMNLMLQGNVWHSLSFQKKTELLPKSFN